MYSERCGGFRDSNTLPEDPKTEVKHGKERKKKIERCGLSGDTGPVIKILKMRNVYTSPMDGTVSQQLFQFSERLSQLQSLLAKQNTIHAALQETLQAGLLLKDQELEYQHTIQSLKQENNRLKELVNPKSKDIDMPKELLHSHLKMDVKPPIIPSSLAKLPPHDSKSAVKLEKMDVKIPLAVVVKLEEDDKGLVIGRKRTISSNNNGSDLKASSSQKLKIPTGPVNTKQVTPTTTENSDESEDSVELNKTPALYISDSSTT
ncbi:hypothetical protein Clacol_010102 [Clathrus columnatus]|uniref:Uncharacterized protein n=1 Tax=Clathrus columnatus TaxID=1419009 RepID=A0AAV5AMJ5_9AGAM|nr:hypothetical protein Clacol_010102 [Clathrus columnatus]